MASTSPAADDPETGVRGPTAFATTHWSLIVRAADAGTAEGRAALAELYRIYWYPLYGFARRRGLAPADAEDLTPGVLADLLARGAVARADAAYSSGGGVMFVSWYENPFHWPQTCA